jgi:plastocyanin
MRKELVIFIILICALVVSGCSSSTAPTPTPAIKPTPVTTPTPVTMPQTGTLANNTNKNISDKGLGNSANIIDVTIKGFAFQPATTTISIGDTIRWTNMDSVNHDVKGDTFDSGMMSPNTTFEFTFTQAGTYNYICSIHPSMQGLIVVQ